MTESTLKLKRSHKKKPPAVVDPIPPFPPDSGLKPKLPPLDPVLAAREAMRHALEGNGRLTLALDEARLVLQTIAVAEWDRETNSVVSAQALRDMARDFLVSQGLSSHSVVRTRAGSADHDVSKMHHIPNYQSGEG